MRALVYFRIGVDIGSRAPAAGGFTQEALERLVASYGTRVIDETHGLMVYKTEPVPLFSSVSAMGRLAVRPSNFGPLVNSLLKQDSPLGEREALAIDLFNASFFQETADGRLLMLVMAIEALLDPAPMSSAAIAVVDEMIAVTKAASGLGETERASLTGRLEELKRESIRQAGLRVVADYLDERHYMGMPARLFFDHCYTFRSQLAHASDPLPRQPDVASASAHLEVMVSDLISEWGRSRNGFSG